MELCFTEWILPSRLVCLPGFHQRWPHRRIRVSSYHIWYVSSSTVLISIYFTLKANRFYHYRLFSILAVYVCYTSTVAVMYYRNRDFEAAERAAEQLAGANSGTIDMPVTIPSSPIHRGASGVGRGNSTNPGSPRGTKTFGILLFLAYLVSLLIRPL